MMRMTGSVPDLRTSRRPAPLRRDFGLLDAIDYTRVAQRRPVLEADIFQHLRQRFVKMRGFAGAPLFARDHRQHLQRRDQSVAGGARNR